MKRFFLIVIVALVGFTGWKLYRHVNDPVAQVALHRRVVRVPVEVADVKRGTVREIGVFTGSLEPRSRYIVSPKITGRLEKLAVNIGDLLTAGQLLATLDDAEYQQKLFQAKAQVDVAKANLQASLDALNFAKRDYERTQALYSRKLISASELDVAKAKYVESQAKNRTAVAQLKEKEAVVEVARIQLSYTRITVPWNDSSAELVVGERFVDEGTLVTPNSQLISVLDVSAMTAVVHVTERDYFKIKIGQPALVESDVIKNRQFKGQVNRIAPAIKETSREATVEIEIENKDKQLHPGLFVRVLINFETHRNSLLVPVNALVKRNGIAGVFQVDTGKQIARFVPVEIGIVEDTHMEILKPQLSGQVVTLGHHLLEDGTPILIPGHNAPDGSQKKNPAQPDRNTSKG